MVYKCLVAVSSSWLSAVVDMSDRGLFEDSQMSASENELSEPDPPIPEVQQHQPDDIDLANEVPQWYRELEESVTPTQGHTSSPHQQRRRRKRSRVIESSSESSEDEEPQIQRKDGSSDDEVKSLIKTLFKKVEKNERLLKNLLHR